MAYTEKYFYNEENDQMLCLTLWETGEKQVDVFEYAGEKDFGGEDDEVEEAEKEAKMLRGGLMPVSAKVDGRQFRCSQEDKKKVVAMIQEGENSLRIAEEMGWELEKANVLIARLHGSDMQKQFSE